jgi:hypothetical protein
MSHGSALTSVLIVSVSSRLFICRLSFGGQCFELLVDLNLHWWSGSFNELLAVAMPA